MRAIFFDSLVGFFSWGAKGGYLALRRSALVALALFALVALTFSAHTQGNQPAYMSFQSALSTSGQNWCIDIPSGSYRPGTPVSLATCSGTPNQTFNTEGGALTAGGLCLDAQGQGAESTVTMAECSGGPSQGWQIQDFQNGQPYLAIVNAESMCITVAYSDARQGAPLTLEYCQEADAQGWVRGGTPAPQAIAGQPTPRIVYNNTYAEPVYYWREGRRFCWYEDGWNGPGWYVCGEAFTRGVGWGGPIWWNNWWAPGQVWIGGGGGRGTFAPTRGTRGTRGTGGTTTTTTVATTTVATKGNTVSTKGNVVTKGNIVTKGTIATTTKGNVTTVATTTKGNITTTVATKGNTTTVATKGNVQTVATKGNVQTVATKGNVQTVATKGNVQTVATKGNQGQAKAGGAGAQKNQQKQQKLGQQKFQQQKFQQQKFQQQKFQQQRQQQKFQQQRFQQQKFQGGMGFQGGMQGVQRSQPRPQQRQQFQRPPSGGGGMGGGGGGGMGGGGGGGGGMRSSDIQLKHDIVRIGTVAEGIGLYRFQYNWSDQIYVGVLAQEVEVVRPDAVARDSDGYLRVDYRRIGAPFDTWVHWQAIGGQGSGR